MYVCIVVYFMKVSRQAVDTMMLSQSFSCDHTAHSYCKHCCTNAVHG